MVTLYFYGGVVKLEGPDDFKIKLDDGTDEYMDKIRLKTKLANGWVVDSICYDKVSSSDRFTECNAKLDWWILQFWLLLSLFITMVLTWITMKLGV